MKSIYLFLLLVHRVTKTRSVSYTEPLGLLSLAESAKARGYPVSVYSGDMYEACALVREQYARLNGKMMVGLYCDFENQSAVACLARQLKSTLPVHIVVGGPQAVALGEPFLRESGADAVFRGEGEYALCSILDAMDKGRMGDIALIPGVGMVCADGIYRDNGISPPIKNLDALPVVSGEIKSLKTGLPNNIPVISGRGCPFNCSFCYEGENGKTVRLRSVGNVMRELRSRLTNNPGIRYICFGDDTFTLGRARLEEFCFELTALRQEHSFVWFADAHVNAVLKEPEIVRMMVEAGLVRMQIGIESCVQEVIDAYKKNIKKEDLFRVIDICKAAGLPQLVGNIIIGGAMETPETLSETFETVRQMYDRAGAMLEVVSTFYTPFPMTAMSREPSRFGIKVCDWDGITSQGDWPMVETSSLSREQISTFRDSFFTDISRLMLRMMDEGLLADEEVLASYRLALYGLHGIWHQFAFSKRPVKHLQYNARAGGNGLLSDYPKEKKWRARPLRTLMLSLYGGFGDEVSRIHNYVFSPLEKEALLLSSGKRNLREIEGILYGRFGAAYSDRQEWEGSLTRIMQSLENNGFITMVKPLDESENAGETGGAVADLLLFRLFSASTEMTAPQERVPSLGIYQLAAWMNKCGFNTFVCECRADEVEGYIRQFNTAKLLAVGFSADYETQYAVRQLSRMVKSAFGSAVLLGGPNAGALGREFLQKSGADAVVTGEGELPLAAILRVLRDGGDFSRIKGIRYIDENGEYTDTGEGGIVENLDDIPFPAYERSLTPVNFEKIYIMSGRGCSYACAFCHESVHKKKLRRRSVKNVLDEARSLLQAHRELKMLLFCDDTLVTNPSWTRDFCRGMSRLREEYDFNWFCEADVISLHRHPDLIVSLKEAGLTRMQIGIESADEKMLEIYNKKITPDMVEDVVRKAYEAGIPQVCGSFIVGGPFENPRHIGKNKAFIERLMRTAPGMVELSPSLLMLYPLTAIGQNPEKYGLTVSDPEGLCSLTDYPVARSAEMDEDAVLRAYQDIVTHVVKVAGEMLKDGSLGHEQLMRCFGAANQASGQFWSRLVVHHKPALMPFYSILARGAARRICDVAPPELPEWRPQRLVEIWRDVNFRKGWPELPGLPLSPLEFDLLTYCTGKLTIRETADRLYRQYGESTGESEPGFLERIVEILREFESRYQMLVVPY